MTASTQREILATVATLLSSSNVRCVVIDRPESGPVHVAAFLLGWPEVQQRLATGLDLAEHVAASGIVGGE
jgi:hypothetical protein